MWARGRPRVSGTRPRRFEASHPDSGEGRNGPARVVSPSRGGGRAGRLAGLAPRADYCPTRRVRGSPPPRLAPFSAPGGHAISTWTLLKSGSSKLPPCRHTPPVGSAFI